jgi:hypothetical protein
MSYGELYFNTRDLITGTNQDAVFQPKTGVVTGEARITLSKVTMPFQAYPFSQVRNNLNVGINVGGVSYQATITPDRTYTGLEMAVELTTILTAAVGVGVTVTYDIPTNKLAVFVSSQNIYMEDLPGSAQNELGYATGSETSQFQGFTFPYPVDLSGTKYIDILATFVSSPIYSSSGSSALLARVPVDVSFGEALIYEPSIQQEARFYENEYMRLAIRDDRGCALQTFPNADIAYIITLRQ